MTEFLIICGLLIVVSGLFYFFVVQNRKQLKQIDYVIKNEATTRGLKIKSIIYPGFHESIDSPFDKEIRIGTLGFEGIPYSRQYYRILKCQDESANITRTMWVRATKNHKTKNVTLEWREQH